MVLRRSIRAPLFLTKPHHAAQGRFVASSLAGTALMPRLSHAACVHDARRWCSSRPADDEIDLFGIVDDIAASPSPPRTSGAVESPPISEAKTSPAATRAGAFPASSSPRPQPQPRQPSSATSGSVSAGGQSTANLGGESTEIPSPAGGFPADPSDAAQILGLRSEALRQSLMRWATEYHRPGRDGAVCEPAVRTDTAMRNLERVANAYVRALKKSDALLRAQMAKRASSTTAGADEEGKRHLVPRAHDTVEWECAYICTSSDIGDLRSRLALIRGRLTDGVNAIAATESDDQLQARRSQWVAASVMAATRHYAASPRATRERIKPESLSSPLSFLSAGLGVLDANPTEDVWRAAFVAATVMNVDTVFFEKLWDKYVAQHAAEGRPEQLDCTVMALQWAAQRNDVQRLLGLFSRFVKRGEFPGGGMEVPLQLYARVLRCAEESHEYDGGLREYVVHALRRTLTLEQLRQSTWEDVASLLTGLDVSSAIGLVRYCSAGQLGTVPYVVWLHLFRRLCREHHVAEAEGMFNFIRTAFSLSSVQRDIVVSLLLKMHCSAPSVNFPAALDLFQKHIVETPLSLHSSGGKEAPLAPRLSHYRLLLKAADSPDAANALWLEMIGDGIKPDESLYAYLFRSQATSKIAATAEDGSDSIPEFLPSALDAKLSIPGNVDSIAAREVALRSIGEPVPELY